MIEQIATVTAIEGDSAWVETQRQSACGACAMNKGCGAGLLAKALGFKTPRLKVTHSHDIEVGDSVVIGIDEQALVRGSFVTYMMPILIMLSLSMLGEGITSSWKARLDSDFVGIATGILGLMLGIMWLKRYSARIIHDRRYQPSVIKKISVGVTSCPVSQL
jgi:sigma-E factor negative regulatory protein RseC